MSLVWISKPRVLRIEDEAMLLLVFSYCICAFLCNCASAWRGIWLVVGKTLKWAKNITDFLRFCYLNIPCLKINITLIFMSSSSDGFTHLLENSKTDVSVGLQWPYLSPSKRHQHGASIQNFITMGKTFFWMCRLWNVTQTWFLARLFVCLSFSISQFLDFLY